MVTYTQNKIHEIWSIADLVNIMLRTDKIKLFKFKQSKGYNSSGT